MIKMLSAAELIQTEGMYAGRRDAALWACRTVQLMEWFKRMQIPLILAAGMALTLAGCASAPIDKTLQTQELLETAGFKTRRAR